jgi:hypothetical protein
MKRSTWTLTDTQRGIWIDSWAIRSADLRLPRDVAISVSKRTLHGGLSDGVDVVEVHNGALGFTVLPTRGMGLWKGNYRGLALGWDSPVRGPVHPAFVNALDRGGLGWLYGFDEWIVRCGLESNGPPGEDVVIDNNGNPRSVPITLHGKIANLPAHFVEVSIGTEPPYEISVTGHVDESGMFCPQLELRSTIRTRAGSNQLTISDEVVNRQGTAAELELLYHCNFGPPFLEGGSQLVVPMREVAPRDARAVEGMDHFDSYLPPTAGYIEQVYWYDLADDPASHATLAMLRNSAADRAVVLRFDKRQLPCFAQWKNTAAGADGYVTGLEPGTNFPNLKRFEREKGRVVVIPTGKSHRCELTIEICDGRPAVQAVEREVARLQGAGGPTVHRRPSGKYSPGGE